MNCYEFLLYAIFLKYNRKLAIFFVSIRLYGLRQVLLNISLLTPIQIFLKMKQPCLRGY